MATPDAVRLELCRAIFEDVNHMETRTYYLSGRFKRFSVILFLGWFILSLGLLWRSIRVSDSGGILASIAMGLVSGTFAFGALRRSASRPYVTLNSEGIQTANPGLPFIPWSDVKALYRHDLTTHSVVKVVLTSADKYAKLAPRWKLSKVAMERTPNGLAVCFLITSLDVPPDQVCREFRQTFENSQSEKPPQSLDR